MATVPDMPFYVFEDGRPMKVIEGKPTVGLMGTNFFEPTHMILEFGAAAVIEAGRVDRWIHQNSKNESTSLPIEVDPFHSQSSDCSIRRVLTAC